MVLSVAVVDLGCVLSVQPIVVAPQPGPRAIAEHLACSVRHERAAVIGQHLVVRVHGLVADAVAADLAHGLLSGDSRGSLLLDEL